ncbi:MAG: serine/threonine protein kinase [Drouetiella hepatica Uher 2000/2452]|jgi:serine/threonine protein kinase|uniref:non-specific serine/threonine protein kinase n=1 Tax=Drouetiella hepatica Uher 2000/2452 TaxID=904376 RepID=A0A951Q9R8_9CYAN|nr:serine/threonine protein kinase [Drouetiella hepatica Uher 2000/2452]
MSHNLPVSTSSHGFSGDNLSENFPSSGLLQNRYRLHKWIGQGGFGKTFLAFDQLQPAQPYCVIKQIMSPLPTCESQPRNALRQEGLRLAELGQHPQIPALLDLFEQGGQGYLVQEFIEGQTLEQELAEAGAFKAAQIRQLLTQLLPVLQFIHDRHIIHRDIKPANIIRHRQDGQLVLVDFGAAKAIAEDLPIQTGTLIGSAEYAAPEQTRGRAVFASDLYSLGVTCIHLLTQMPPFDLFDTGEDAWNWQNFLPHPIDSSLAHILNRLLQPAINRRYQFASEVLEDLTFLPQAEVNPASGASSSVSATVYEPLTRKWHHISDLREQSELVWAVAPFLRPHAIDFPFTDCKNFF